MMDAGRGHFGEGEGIPINVIRSADRITVDAE